MINAVGVIIRNSENQILVYKNKNNLEGNTYKFVCGKIEIDESSTQAAIREMKEEIGVEFQENGLIFIKNYQWIRDDISLDFDVNLIKLERNDLVVDLQKQEVTEYLWETKENLLERNDLMIGLYEILKEFN